MTAVDDAAFLGQHDGLDVFRPDIDPGRDTMRVPCHTSSPCATATWSRTVFDRCSHELRQLSLQPVK